jgi:Lipocalin-like domain
MKKQFPLFSIVVIAVIFFFPSCQEDDNLPVIKTKTQLITSGAWSFDKAFQGTVDISAQVPICYKDNIVSFTSSTNGTVLNPVLCTPDTTPATFTWTFQSGETVLNLSAALFPGGNTNFNIVTLSETSLVISQDVIIPPLTTPTNVIFHYKH